MTTLPPKGVCISWVLLSTLFIPFAGHSGVVAFELVFWWQKGQRARTKNHSYKFYSSLVFARAMYDPPLIDITCLAFNHWSTGGNCGISTWLTTFNFGHLPVDDSSTLLAPRQLMIGMSMTQWPRTVSPSIGDIPQSIQTIHTRTGMNAHIPRAPWSPSPAFMHPPPNHHTPPRPTLQVSQSAPACWWHHRLNSLAPCPERCRVAARSTRIASLAKQHGLGITRIYTYIHKSFPT